MGSERVSWFLAAGVGIAALLITGRDGLAWGFVFGLFVALIAASPMLGALIPVHLRLRWKTASVVLLLHVVLLSVLWAAYPSWTDLAFGGTPGPSSLGAAVEANPGGVAVQYPLQADVLAAAGRIDLVRGDVADAQSLLQQAVALDPEPTYLSLLGQAQGAYEQGSFSSSSPAALSLDTAAFLDPYDAQALYSLGYLYYQNGGNNAADYAAALHYFLEAASINPGNQTYARAVKAAAAATDSAFGSSSFSGGAR